MKSAEDADKDERLMHLEAQLMVMKTIDVHKEAERRPRSQREAERRPRSQRAGFEVVAACLR